VQQITMEPDMPFPKLECKLVLNKKAAVADSMVAVMHKIVDEYFGEKVTFESPSDPIGTPMIVEDTRQVSEMMMYPPTTESNDSPSYPGLKSTYYLHRFDVCIQGIPVDNFRTMKKTAKGVQVFLWEWVEASEVKKLGANSSIVEYYLGDPSRLKGLIAAVEYFHKAVAKQKIKVMPQEELIRRVDDVIMGMLTDQLKAAAKVNEHQTLRVIISEIRARQNDRPEAHKAILETSINLALQYNAKETAQKLVNEFWELYPSDGKQTGNEKNIQHYNHLIVVAALINSPKILLKLRSKFVNESFAKYCVAPLCIAPVVLGMHAESLDMLLQMVTNHSHVFMMNLSDSLQTLNSTVGLFKLGKDTKETIEVALKKWQVPGKKPLAPVFVRAGIEVDDPFAEFSIINFFNRILTQVKVSPSDEYASCAIPSSTFSWGKLLGMVCPVTRHGRNVKPLKREKASLLSVILCHCPPCNAKYRQYLEIFLVSMVNYCWKDVTELGYERESQRQIIAFLRRSRFPFHTALFVTEALRKLTKQTLYLENEFGVLASWMEKQVVDMLEQSQSQEEANAMLFERTRVQARSSNDFVPTCETTALYLAIKTENELVVSNKWFQGASTRRIWFYRWWDPSSYPYVFDTPSHVMRAWVFCLLFVELILLMPMWCARPFSQTLARKCEKLIFNCAYFKFVANVALYFGYLAVLMTHAISDVPVRYKMPGKQLNVTNAIMDLSHRGYAGVEVLPMSNVEIVTAYWTLALLAAEVQMWIRHTATYFKSITNRMDVLALSSLLLGCCFRIASTDMFLHLPGKDRYYYFETSEVCFSFGSTFAVLRLTHLFSYYAKLGPLYQSIISMLSDISSFIFLVLVSMFSFWVGFVFLLRRFFSSNEDANWTSSGGVATELVNIVFRGEVPDDVQYCNADAEITGECKDSVDVFVFNVLILIFLTLVVIIMLNLLIAMMTTTYENTEESSIRVHLNGRMRLIEDYAVLQIVPAPFNLITLPFAIIGRAINYFRYGYGGFVKEQAKVPLMERNSGLIFKLPAYTTRNLRENSNKTKQNLFAVHYAEAQMSEPRFPSSLARATPSERQEEIVRQARKQELQIKEEYNRNNALRKYRCIVMNRYFESIVKKISLPEPGSDAYRLILTPPDPLFLAKAEEDPFSPRPLTQDTGKNKIRQEDSGYTRRMTMKVQETRSRLLSTDTNDLLPSPRGKAPVEMRSPMLTPLRSSEPAPSSLEQYLAAKRHRQTKQ